MAVCSDNVTDLSSKDTQSESAAFNNYVETFICQSTIIPADGRGFRTAISSQSISLADTFLGMVHHSDLQKWKMLYIIIFKIFILGSYRAPSFQSIITAAYHPVDQMLTRSLIWFYPYLQYLSLLGATVENTLNGVSVRPDIFPKTSQRLPDINFFYQ